jgi:hypothetical protein
MVGTAAELVEIQQHLMAALRRHVPRSGEAGDAVAVLRGGSRVQDVEVTVDGEFGIEREAEQPALNLADRRNGGERLGEQTVAQHHAYRSALLGDENAPVRCQDHARRALESLDDGRFRKAGRQLRRRQRWRQGGDRQHDGPVSTHRRLHAKCRRLPWLAPSVPDPAFDTASHVPVIERSRSAAFASSHHMAGGMAEALPPTTSSLIEIAASLQHRPWMPAYRQRLLYESASLDREGSAMLLMGVTGSVCVSTPSRNESPSSAKN